MQENLLKIDSYNVKKGYFLKWKHSYLLFQLMLDVFHNRMAGMMHDFLP